ncbi:hypothetical protein, partial [Cellvibrio mixtus]|uniref:hypothetical protein n=1 Tax=Cellvibrio mixtus TaxID=39650 RepID=UPI00190F8454
MNVGALTSPSGLGEIRANGSNGRDVSGGGGGRIAIYYESKTGLNDSKITATGGNGQSSGKHGAPGTVYIKDKTDLSSAYLKIQGAGSGAAYSYTPLNDVTNESKIIIENANTTISETVLNGNLNIINSNVRIENPIRFTQPLSLLNSKLEIQSDVTFEHFIAGSNASSEIVEVGGQLTVPGNNLVVDGITLSLAKNHIFNSIHIKNGGVLT